MFTFAGSLDVLGDDGVLRRTGGAAELNSGAFDCLDAKAAPPLLFDMGNFADSVDAVFGCVGVPGVTGSSVRHTAGEVSLDVPGAPQNVFASADADEIVLTVGFVKGK